MTPPFFRRALTVAAGALCVAAMTAQPAAAGNGSSGNETDTGFSVSVKVTYSGSAAPSGGGTQAVTMPVKCYWTPVEGPAWLFGGEFDPTDPEALLEELNKYTDSVITKEDVEKAIADIEAGRKPVLYEYKCKDLVDAIGHVTWAFLNETEEVPPPLVDPKDLADAAFKDMDLKTPEVDRNPKAATAGSGAATLVNLPTWFWVTNPDSVGGDDGTETIRAEVEGTPVFAELTATTNGLSISSPVGGEACSPERAQVEYRRGVNDNQACTVVFGRASQGAGWPVTATTAWNATWVGRTQDGQTVGDTLGGTSRATTIDVPVAEVQTLVRPE